MSEIENWMRLAKLESPRKTLLLVEHFGSPEAVFQATDAELADVPEMTRRTAEKIHTMATQSVDAELKALQKANGHIVTYRDPEYPVNLRQIYDPPVVLFVRGELREDDRLAVAIVGTRKPSEYGRSMSMKIGRDLSKAGITIVSGGARGIDTAAHSASVAADGRTIAVLGCGVDVAYPYENRGLLNRIAETGAVVSEFVPGTKPDAWRFPVRNRIVSGMSLGVLVVESRSVGGAMITATIAGEQGKDVWAIPGGTDSSTSEGPHRLIKDGAKLVDCAEDILRDLGIDPEIAPKQPTNLPDNLTPEQKSVLQVLSLQPKHVDDITQECGLTAPVTSSTLTLLEMMGLVRRVPGNSYVRAV